MTRRAWLLLAGGLVSSIGDRFAAIAYTLLAADRGDTRFLAAVFVAEMLPTIVFSLAGGIVTDFFIRRWLWPVALLAQAGCFGGMALQPNEAMIIALVMVASCCASIVGPVSTSLARRLVADEAIPQLARWQASSQSISSVIGNLAGAATYSIAPVGVLFGVNAGTFLVLAAVGAVIVRRVPTVVAERTGSGLRWLGGEAIHGFRLLFAPDAFGLAGGAMLACTIVGSSLEGLVGVFVLRRLIHLSAFEYGLTNAVWMGAMVLGSIGVGRSRLRWQRAMPLAGIVMGVSLALPPLTESFAVTLIAYLFGGMANGGFNRYITTGIYAAAKPTEQGRVAAAFGLLGNGCGLLGYLLGALPGSAHARTMMLISGVVPAITGVVALATRRGLVRQPT